VYIPPQPSLFAHDSQDGGGGSAGSGSGSGGVWSVNGGLKKQGRRAARRARRAAAAAILTRQGRTAAAERLARHSDSGGDSGSDPEDGGVSTAVTSLPGYGGRLPTTDGQSESVAERWAGLPIAEQSRLWSSDAATSPTGVPLLRFAAPARVAAPAPVAVPSAAAVASMREKLQAAIARRQGGGGGGVGDDAHATSLRALRAALLQSAGGGASGGREVADADGGDSIGAALRAAMMRRAGGVPAASGGGGGARSRQATPVASAPPAPSLHMTVAAGTNVMGNRTTAATLAVAGSHVTETAGAAFVMSGTALAPAAALSLGVRAGTSGVVDEDPGGVGGGAGGRGEEDPSARVAERMRSDAVLAWGDASGASGKAGAKGLWGQV